MHPSAPGERVETYLSEDHSQLAFLYDSLKNYHKADSKKNSMEFLKIDGSFGEGGGQIIRTAVTLSCITQKPIQIENIRKNRKVPGLRAQHLTGIKLLAKICNARVDGLKIGATSIRFAPKKVETLNLTEKIGTAGSIPLILQVLIPAVSLAKKNLKLSIVGGTDVPWSPTANYTKFVISEAYSRMGINFTMKIKKRGYYPKGGGIIDLDVFPCEKLNPISCTNRTTKNAKLICSYSNLPLENIDDDIKQIQSSLREAGFESSSEIKEETAIDRGGSLLVFSFDSKSIIGIDQLIDSRKGSFDSSIINDFIKSNLGVDYHLADMLVLPASLNQETSIFRVESITKHLETNLYVTSKITNCKYGVGKLEKGYEVRIKGSSDSCIE